MQTSAIEVGAALSPDARFLAYRSNESGVDEIYVRPFPRVRDGWWQVSMGGGTNPVWSRDGRELFYLDPLGTLTAVPVRTSGAVFERGRGVKLFNAGFLLTEGVRSVYDVAPDGRFLLIKEQAAGAQAAGTPRMVVLLNFFEELKRLLPAD